MWSILSTRIQRDRTPKNLCRSVGRIIVSKHAYPFHHNPARIDRRATIVIILSTNCQRDSVSNRHNDARWPDFNFDVVSIPGYERLYFVMRMIGPVGQREI